MGDYVPNIVLLFHKQDLEEKRRRIMENLKVGDIKTIAVEVDAIMTGLNSGSRVRVTLPSGEKVWLNPEMLNEFPNVICPPFSTSVTFSAEDGVKKEEE